MRFRPVLGGEGHIGQDILLGGVHERGELWEFSPHLLGHDAPLGFGGLVVELEVGAKTNAEFGEKSAERMSQRNGYRKRDWQTRAGQVEKKIPWLRTGSYFPSFLEPRLLVEKGWRR